VEGWRKGLASPPGRSKDSLTSAPPWNSGSRAEVERNCPVPNLTALAQSGCIATWLPETMQVPFKCSSSNESLLSILPRVFVVRQCEDL
jgi:hypothetical protein